MNATAQKQGAPVAGSVIKIRNYLPSRLPQEWPEVEVICRKVDLHGLA
jgi:hypothetical protein